MDAETSHFCGQTFNTVGICGALCLGNWIQNTGRLSSMKQLIHNLFYTNI